MLASVHTEASAAAADEELVGRSGRRTDGGADGGSLLAFGDGANTGPGTRRAADDDGAFFPRASVIFGRPIRPIRLGRLGSVRSRRFSRR